MSNHRDIFADYLKQKTLKFAVSRNTVLQEIFKVHGHFEIGEFIGQMTRNFKNISRATIYRTLVHLLDAKLIQKFSDEHGRTFYEHVFGHPHHDHLICTKCSKVIEIENTRLEQVKEEACKNAGFSAERHVLQIYGLCRNCQNQEQYETK